MHQIVHCGDYSRVSYATEVRKKLSFSPIYHHYKKHKTNGHSWRRKFYPNFSVDLNLSGIILQILSNLEDGGLFFENGNNCIHRFDWCFRQIFKKMPRQVKKGDATRAVAREEKLQVIRDRVAANAAADKEADALEMAQIAAQEQASEAAAGVQRAKRNRAQTQELAELDTPVKAGAGIDSVSNRDAGIAAEKERIAGWMSECIAREDEKAAVDSAEDKLSNARILAQKKEWGAHYGFAETALDKKQEAGASGCHQEGRSQSAN
jgi:hypothetical protein